MGLFSRKKTDRTKWTCKFCGQETSIKDISAVLREGQVTSLASGQCEGIVAEKDEVFCNRCSLGGLPRDQEKRFEEFAKKIVENYDAITLAEVIGVITDLEVFISRLKIYNLYFNERIEQLRSTMEQILQNAAFPKLKEQIANFIKNEHYNEAKMLCVQGTNWANSMKNKGKWEHDLKLIETIIELSKSTSGQKMVIEAPQKTLYVAAQNDGGDTALSKFKAESHLNMAIEIVSNNGDLQFALNYCDQAIEIYERLVNTEGGKELGRNLAGAYYNKAVGLSRFGDNPASMEFYDKAIEIFERLVNTEGRKELGNHLAMVYRNRAAVLSHLGDNPASV